MSLINSIWLGIVQGLAEFLPISSSAHLTLFSEWLNVDLGGDMISLFVVLLHVGTLLAVLICYRKRVWLMIRHPLLSEFKWLVVATVPTVIYAVLKPDSFDALERTLMPFSFLFTALILYIGEYVSRMRELSENTHKKVKWYDALAMGFMQIIGTLPGVSRSGSTLFGGLATGLTRKSTADFCFLMSIPAVCGAALLDAYEIVKSPAGFSTLGEIGGMQILVGIATAAVCGIIAIKFMLMLLKKLSLKWFSLYMGIMGIVLILNDFMFHWW